MNKNTLFCIALSGLFILSCLTNSAFAITRSSNDVKSIRIMCNGSGTYCTNNYYSLTGNINTPVIVSGNVMCTSDLSLCTAGDKLMASNNNVPLTVRNGVVCTSDGRICTNGEATYRTNKTVFR